MKGKKMKKIITFAACAILVGIAQAATVGWNVATGSTTYANDAYEFYIIGQNGATSVDTITALLDAGSDTSSYVYGSGTIAANGAAIVAAANSGKSLDAGSYTGFFVLFDSSSPTAGDQYMVISGQTGLTKTIASTTATVVFTTGNVSSAISSGTWSTYGVPEPTSGLLMLLGVAGLTLRRRRV